MRVVISFIHLLLHHATLYPPLRHNDALKGFAAQAGPDINRALQLQQQGNYEGAEKLHLHALERKTKDLGRDSLQVAITLINIVIEQVGRSREALT